MARFFVGNMPYSASKEDLAKALEAWDPSNIDMVKDKLTGRFRGYAFVDLSGFSGEEEVRLGIRNLHFGKANR
jgi:RNA recognition motif-containing protein